MDIEAGLLNLLSKKIAVHALAKEIEILHSNKGNGKSPAAIISVVNIIVAIISVHRQFATQEIRKRVKRKNVIKHVISGSH
jgi:hypothetical protein